MLNLLLSHTALGLVLGLGSRATVLFLPSVAALIEGGLVSIVSGHPIILGSGVAFALVATIQVGYVIGSFVSDPMKAAR